MNTSVPILMYHLVTPRPLPGFRKYSLTPDSFAAQMKWLALAGYTTITLDDLLAFRNGRAGLCKRPVIITFDDGYQDCVEYAGPILAAHGFTAIFYLVAGLSGRTSRWLRPELGCEFPLVSWETARQLEVAGFQCGAHSMSHPRLAEVSVSMCRAELLDCRHLLEDRLGHEVQHLAYPYGSYNESVREIAAQAGYVSACSTRKGLSAPDDDSLALHRVPVYGHDTVIDFICRLHNRCTPREWLRHKTQSTKQWLGHPESF